MAEPTQDAEYVRALTQARDHVRAALALIESDDEALFWDLYGTCVELREIDLYVLTPRINDASACQDLGDSGVCEPSGSGDGAER